MKTFQDKINSLRSELIQSIVSILRDNNLTELSFNNSSHDKADYDGTDPVFVVAFDGDGEAYDCVVEKVSVTDGGYLELEVKHKSSDMVFYVDQTDIGCQNLDWLSDIRDKITDTLKIEVPPFTRHEEILVLYSCDAWHTWSSHQLLGVFSDREALGVYFDKMQEAGKLDEYDMESLHEINQTQGHEINFNILTEKLNPLYQ